MNTCDNCKFWKPKTEETCEGYTPETHGGDCLCPKFRYSQNLTLDAPDELIFADYESYQAGLATGSKFGCVHFDQK